MGRGGGGGGDRDNHADVDKLFVATLDLFALSLGSGLAGALSTSDKVDPAATKSRTLLSARLEVSGS